MVHYRLRVLVQEVIAIGIKFRDNGRTRVYDYFHGVSDNALFAKYLLQEEDAKNETRCWKLGGRM